MERIRELLGLDEYSPADLSAEDLTRDQEAVKEALGQRDDFTTEELRKIIGFGKAVKTELTAREELDAEIAELTVEPDPDVKVAELERPAKNAPVEETVEETESEEPVVTLVAASGSPGSGPASGPDVESVDELGTLMADAWRGTSPPSTGSMWSRVAQKRWKLDHAFEVNGSVERNYLTSRQVLRDAAEQAKAQVYGDGALQSASGICGPLTPRYSFFNPIDGGAGLLQVPEVALERGGVRIPSALTYDDLRALEAIGGEYTSDDGDAGSLTKQCYTVACPTISDFTVAAYSNCLRFSNFQGQFFPEYVTDTTGAAQATHAHKVNRAMIAAVVASADTVAYVSSDKGGGALVQFARNVAFHAALYRDKYRLGQDAVLDFVWTYRAYAVLIADLAARDSTTGNGLVLDAWLADLGRLTGARFQFVYDWEDMTEAPGDFGSEDYPFLVFVPGEVMHITGGTLDIGVVRDSTRNANNEFDIFSETFDGIAVNGYEIMSVTGTTLCPTGETGQREAITCSTGS